MAENNLTYERRDGTDSDLGIHFEWQTTILAYLRCEKLHRQWVQDNTLGVKSYFVANNVDGIGAFDDVVIRVEYPHKKEDKNKLIFVQCKHCKNPKKYFIEKLLNREKVQKFFDSFIEVLRILNDHRALSCQTYKEIHKKTKRRRTQEMERNTEKEQNLRNLFQCKPQDCEFILYSNIILESGFGNMQTQQENDISMKILNTDGSKKFNILLNTEQIEYLPNEQFSNEREIFEELKQEFTTKFRIIVNQVDKVNFDILRSIIPKADIRGISPLLEEEVKCMFKNTLCTAVTQNLQLLENIENFSKLITIEKNEMESFLRIPENVRLFSKETIEKLQKQLENCSPTKIYTSCKQLEKLKLKQSVTNGFLESKLLVYIKDEDDFSIWTKARKSKLYRNLNQIIVCIEESNNLYSYDRDSNEVFIEIHHDSEINHSSCFAQFSDETYNSILNHAITFQGFTVTVNDICGDEWCHLLDELIICRILKGVEITIGSKGFNPLDCYIERKLQFKELVDKNVDKKVNLVPFVEMIHDVKTETKSLTEDEIIAIENKKALLLSGPAGIGKSTTLKSLALKYKNKNPKYFVYFIELNKYMNVLKKYEENCDVAGAIEFLAQKILSLQQLEYRLFVYACAEKKNVALFFDAFDEISPDGEKKFSSFLETLLKSFISTIFVSSRPNFIGTLETKLNQKSLIFVPFSLDDKNLFFLKYYEKLMIKNATSNEKLEMENVISQIIKSMEEETELMAIPLQITMLAEILFDKFSEMTTEEKMSFSKKMDVCSLYTAFIEKLVERYLVEKKKLILQDEEKIIAIRDKMRDAEELACKLICPDINQTPLTEYSDAILKMCNQVGLITNIDPPVFLHRTYGEYLSANWFVKCILNHNTNNSAYVSFLCEMVLTEDEYSGIRKFINAILFNLNSRGIDSYIINPDIKIMISPFFGENSLFVAVEEEHAEIVKLLVQNDPSEINETDGAGFTAVELACRSGCFKSVEILYLNNCLTNVRNMDGDTVLHCAAEGNNTNIIHLILEKDKKLLKKTNDQGDSSFTVACKRDNIEAVICLLNIDKDLVNIVDQYGNLPFHYATAKGNIRTIIELLSHNSNLINIKNNDGLFPLHIACEKNHIDVAKYLLTRKSSGVSMKCGEKEETPLHFAARNSNVELLKLILQHDKTLLNTCNLLGESPLICALIRKQTAEAKFLLTFKNCVVNEGENPLTFAAKIQDEELMSLILERDETLLNKCNLKGESPLICALIEKRTAAAKFLLTFSNCVVNEGKNPLTFAAKIQDIELMSLILERDETLLNTSNLKGESPLISALREERTAAAKFFLTFPNCVVNVGENPLTFAAKIQDLELISLILQRDETLLNTCNLKGESPLISALREDRTAAAKFFLTFPNCVVNVGENPLTFAAKIQDIELMSLILQRDETLLNTCNLKGESPLISALREERTAAAKFFLAFPNCVVNVGENPLTFAAKIQDIELMSLILQRDETFLNTRNLKGESPLISALREERTAAAKFFLTFPNCVVNEGENPLIFAAKIGDVELMTRILQHDQTLINKCNLYGNTPLICAIIYKKTAAAKFLLTFPYCVVKPNENPLTVAAEIEDVDLLRNNDSLDCTLLNRVGENCSEALTPLLCASFMSSNIEATNFLTELPECSLTVNTLEETPFHYAAMRGDVEIIKLLINKDRSLLLKQNKIGKTALSYAIDFWKTEIARTLLSCDEYFLEGNILQNELESALKTENCFEIMTIMLERQPSLINLKNSKELLPLDIACECNNTEAVKYLLPRTDSTLILRGENNDSILHIAAKNGNLIITKNILDNFPTLLNQLDSRGFNALHYASEYNKTEVVKLLVKENCQINVIDDEQPTSLVVKKVQS